VAAAISTMVMSAMAMAGEAASAPAAVEVEVVAAEDAAVGQQLLTS
jgi:hypothetical protein